MNKDSHELKLGLDRLAGKYDAAWRETDPVALVHRYDDPADIEVAGLAVSLLAYGSAGQIRRSAELMLERAGGSPAMFAAGLTVETTESVFSGLKHRWTTSSDMARAWFACGEMIRRYGSIGACVRSIDRMREPTIEHAITRFADIFNHYAGARLIPSPADGSACKRPALYFRWMVRNPDGIDFGMWDFIAPSRLVIPLDRHIARMGRNLVLTVRRSDDWNTALDITRSLALLDPRDPVRYDFALVRPGILGLCSDRCAECPLGTVCRESKFLRQAQDERH